MRDTSRHRWQRWRATLAGSPTTGDRFGVTAASATVGVGSFEKPGPDGIRHALVARVRAEIAAGTYDTEEKWLAAEEALLRRIEQRM